MAYEIIWSPEAIRTFDSVIEYLHQKWTTAVIIKFIDDSENIIHLISKNPYLFRKSEKENIHQVLVTKQNLLLYQVNEHHKRVELLSFLDARQNPKKKPTIKK